VTDTGRANAKRRRTWIIAGSAVAALAVVGVILLVWYLNQPVPEEVSIEGAVEGVATTATGGSDGVPPIEPLDGSWGVNTEIGEFSFEDASSSFVGFRIDEELTSIGATTAVGRTPAVSGSFTLEGTTITDAVIEADMTAIVTNADRRNRAVQRALATEAFPTATFTLTAPIELGSIPEVGVPASAIATGELFIKGVSVPIDIPLEAQIVPLSTDQWGDVIAVVGSVDITFADWGVEVPSAPVVVSADDHGILEMQLLFTRT